MKTSKKIMIGAGVLALIGGAAWWLFGRGKRVGDYLVKAMSKSPRVPTGYSLIEAEAQEVAANDAGALGAFGAVYPGKYPDTAKAYYIWASGGFGKPTPGTYGTFFMIDNATWVSVKRA